jgi:hypothetical protein
MGTVTLTNGEKIEVVSVNYDTSLEFLIGVITPIYSGSAINALAVLSEIGEEASSALPQIELVLDNTMISPTYRRELERTVCAIKSKLPPKKESSIEIVQDQGTDLTKDAQLFRKCNFCEKETLIKSDVQIDRLCPPGRFYCRFCLRHSLYNRDNRHVLMFSMKSVLGYYFWQFYYGPPKPHVWISEIKDYADLHEEVGMRNPVFNYDPETYTWFIDFLRVGDSKKKLPLQEIKKTIVEMLAVFNMHVYVKGLSMSLFYAKYSDAIDEFYQKRFRPDGKRILTPTFKGCGSPEWGQLSSVNLMVAPTYGGNKVTIEDTKSFTPLLLKEHLWNKS